VLSRTLTGLFIHFKEKNQPPPPLKYKMKNLLITIAAVVLVGRPV